MSLTESDLELNASLKTLKGRVDLSASNQININEKIDIEKLDSFNASLILNGLVIGKEDLANLNSNPKKEKKKSKGGLVPMRLNFELKNVILFNEVINGTGEFLAKKNEMALKNVELKHGDGVVLANATSAGNKHKFNIETNKLNAQIVKGFLDEDSPYITGLINASLVGKATSGNTLSYDAFLKGNSVKGELKNYDLSGMVNSHVDKVNSLPYFNKKPLKKVKLPQDYEKIYFDIHASSKKTIVKKVTFQGVKRKIEIKSQGTLVPKGNSELYVNIFDSKRNYLKFLKEVDMTSFPTKLKGAGYDLKPDYDYTLKFVRKKAEKRLKKKAKKAVKKAAKKELKKLEKKILKDKKVKDLLKGLL